jgi:hypothetical protein
MTDREVQVLNRAGLKDRYNTVLGLVEKYERQGLHKEIQSIALAGQAKRGWYKESGQLLEEMFAEDFPRFAALLGATSPKLSVKGNLTNALNIWKNWDAAGRPQDAESIKDILATSVQGTKGKQSVMEAWVPNTISALTEADENLLLSGGKVDSFMRNIMGDPDAVTLDTWMANYFGTKQSNFSGGKNPDWIGDPGFTADYMATSIIVRKGAKELSQRTGENWTPAEIQETVWSFTKTVVEMRRNGDPRSIMEIIKSGEITNDLVRGTDDFATLMGDEGITSIIEGTPYGRRLREATERSRATGGGEQGAASTSSSSGIEPAPRHLVRAGRRLERNYRDAAEPGIIRDIRKSLDLPFTSRLDGGQTSGTGRAGHRNTDEGTGTFTRTNRTYRTDKLGKLPYRAVYQLSAKHAGKLNNIGRSTPALVELDSSPAAGRLFREKITASKEASEFGAAVYLYEADEYAAMRLFVTRDGTSGFAIKPDGDIVSVFNVAGGKHTKVTPNLLLLAVEQGGRRLDCFDTQLPEIYSHSGFRAVSRTKWVDEFAPEDWDKTVFGNFNNGEPDVVYMVYDPSYTPTKEKLKYKKSHGKVVGDPDEAAQLQSIELESLGQMGEDDLRGIYSGYTGASQ